METQNAIVVQRSDEDGITSLAIMSDQAMMDRIFKFAEIMASGRATIPQELRNVGDCLAITMQAMNWKMNPFSVAQKTFFVGGKIGYEAQLVAAAVTNSGATVGGFHFEWFGDWTRIVGKFKEVESKTKKDDYGNGVKFRVPAWSLDDEKGLGIKVWATLRGEDEPRVLELLMAQARTRNSTLWADDPKQQLAYLAQKRWARLYTPGVILGVYTPDELQEQTMRDMGEAETMASRPLTPGATTNEVVLPEYVENDGYREDMKKFGKVIAAGKKSPQDVVTLIKTKFTVSAAMEAKVIAELSKHLHQAEPAQQPEQPQENPHQGFIDGLGDPSESN